MTKPPAKHARYLLVDFENIQKMDIQKIPNDIRIRIFLGEHQKKIDIDVIKKTQQRGSSLAWIQIEGNGNNALDMVIAYVMGKIYEEDPQAHCIVFSHDKGFDPLIKHLKKESKDCRRIDRIEEI